MSIQILINNSTNPEADYVGWAPHPCQISSTDGAVHSVVLKNLNPATGGQVVFKKAIADSLTDTLVLKLPANGNPVSFFIAGKFDPKTGKGSPSTEDKDCIITVVDKVLATELGRKELMVRVRKDANTITSSERDRFLAAIVQLNQQGKYLDFQNMHTLQASPEIHKRSSFLPWHRGYLLDFERKLQAIDPAVALPYWKFDVPAPHVFTQNFMGVPDSSGAVNFSNTNPLVNWQPMIFGQGTGRIRRVARFNTATQPASKVHNDENATLALGLSFTTFGQNNVRKGGFSSMETDPHGGAHTSFTGQISDIGRAPADPLFFLIHTNIDRLWAKWQWITDGQRFDAGSADAYPHQGNGNASSGGEFGIGDFVNDTMWPWNGVFKSPRPTTGPDVRFTNSPAVKIPTQKPDVKSMIDYQGQKNVSSNLGFAYADVPYDHL